MNNALLSDPEPEEKDDKTPILRKRETELAMTIEAITKVAENPDWLTLKKLVFDGVLESLERLLKQEASKPELNTSEIYRLNGQIIWAKKYADLTKLSNGLRIELANTRKQLKN